MMQSDKRKALGRGLDALLPSRNAGAGNTSAKANMSAGAVGAIPASREAAEGAAAAGAAESAITGGTVREIPIGLIENNPYQTRHKVDEAALHELTESIRESGVLQPILVRPSSNGLFQLMAGERRWMAARGAGLETVPAVVKAASDQQALEFTIIENLQREDLNPMEQARAFERLSVEFQLTQEQIAKRTAKDRASVANYMRLLKLPDYVQAGIASGVITTGHGKAMLMLLNDPASMKRAWDKMMEIDMSVRQAEQYIHGLLSGPGEYKTEKPLVPRDPNVRAAEQELQRSLGCRVTIKDKGGRGKIVLEYATLEDFDRVVEVLSGK